MTLQTSVEVKIEEMLRKGERWNVIAKTLHVSKRTIAKVARMMHEVSPRKAIELFEQGKSAVDVVRETNEDITKIANWYKSWVEAVECQVRYETTLKGKYEEIKTKRSQRR